MLRNTQYLYTVNSDMQLQTHTQRTVWFPRPQWFSKHATILRYTMYI